MNPGSIPITASLSAAEMSVDKNLTTAVNSADEAHNKKAHLPQGDSSPLLHRAVKKAEKMPVLRIFITTARNFGAQNSAFDTLRSWLSISTPEKIELLYSHSMKLSVLAPGFDDTRKSVQTVDLFGRKVDVVHVSKAVLSPCSIGIYTGSFPDQKTESVQKIQKNMCVENLMCIQPYGWEPECDGWFEGSTYHRMKGQSEFLHLNPVNRSCITSQVQHLPHIAGEDAASELMKKETQTALNQIIAMRQNNDLDLAVIYGVHIKPVLRNLESVMRNLTCAYSQVKRKKTVLLILSSLFPDAKQRVRDACQGLGNIRVSDIHQGELPDLDNPDNTIEVLFCAKLPKPVFEQMVYLSNLPALFEGANTYQLVQSLGKNHLSLRPNATTKLYSVDCYPDASRKLSYASACLALDRAKIKKAHDCISQGLVPDQLKSEFCSFLQQLHSDSSYHQQQEDFLLSPGIFELYRNSHCEPYLDMPEIFCDSRQAMIACQLLAQFFKAPFPLGKTDKAHLIARLFQEDLFIDFLTYIEQETVTALKDFIQEAMDEDSDISKMSRYLQQRAADPENNKLLQLLDQMPEHLFEASS